MDWGGFTHWLEADPRHRQAYDEVALTGALLDDHPELLAGNAELVPVERDERVVERRSWPVWLGTGVAASLAAVIVAMQAIPPTPETFESGQAALTVNLGRESTAVLAPHSRLTISGRGGTRLALEGGAYFDIRHDSTRTLRVTVGNLTVTDIGTRFDIRQRPAQIQVEVADGEVAVQSAGLDASLELRAGRRLQYDVTASRAVVSAVDGAAVGGWREGRLSYDSVPLELVAADLARYASVRLVVPHALAQRRFSGTLFIGDGDSAIRDLAQLMELDLHRDGDAYRLEPAG
jgi:transmembrane sensor